MPRVPIPERKDLSKEGQAAWVSYLASRGKMATNFKAFAYSGVLMERLADLGAYLRFQGPLPQDLREIAIIVTARQMDAHFVWTAHAPAARREGVKEEVISAIQGHRPIPESATAEQRAVVRYAESLLTKHDVEDRLFEEVKGYVGVQGVIDLSMLIGYYVTVGLTSNALGIQAEPGSKPTLDA
jgi:4-carboxymuconolactone decarboxylase